LICEDGGRGAEVELVRSSREANKSSKSTVFLAAMGTSHETKFVVFVSSY
jgi:hypothetical protein